MNVYVRYIEEMGVRYRWNTLLQFGDAWDVKGSVVMKNPGSSDFSSDDCLIRETDILQQLETLSVMEEDVPWYSFRADRTMECIQEIFEDYYNGNLNGVIRIFNLCNVMSADFSPVKSLLKKGGIDSKFFCTVEDDIKAMAGPVYFGWGDAWKFCRNTARLYYEAGVKHNEAGGFHYSELIEHKFYHPLYLMRYGKGKVSRL